MMKWRSAVLWLGLVGAFSPVVADLLCHCAAEPWARYALVFVPLLAVCVRQSRAGARQSADGYLWLLAGILIELVAIRADAIRMARPGLALAVIGLCRAFGLASAPASALVLWLIPVPSMILALASPDLEMAWARLALGPLGWLGAQMSLEGARVLAPAGVLALRPSDGGLTLLALLSGLGWYASIRAGRDAPAAARRALAWGASAIPIQAAGMLLALGALASGSPELARPMLDSIVWGVAAAVALAWIELRLWLTRRREDVALRVA
jgi:hypothetical protein